MANQDSTSNITVNQFTGGLKKDMDLSLLKADSWTHARNAVGNTHTGQLGVLSSEPANFLCARLPYTYIGAIHIIADKWAVFTTDNFNAEIGLFNETDCSYKAIVNDPGLGFNTAHLITGAAKKNFDCTYSVYWDDGLNPSRKLNIDRPVYKIKTVRTTGACAVPEYTNKLDIDKLRLVRSVATPGLKLSMGNSGGTLPNGSYQVAVAYTVNQIRVTDYFTPSNVQSLFSHRNMQGALHLELSGMDTEYEEFELVIMSSVNQQVTAQKLGNYSTRQKDIPILNLHPALPVVPLEYIPQQSPSYERSDAMYEVGDYLIRTGIYTKPDFNYQPLANKIRARWTALEVPASYYAKGGNLTSYMRDEVYAFFIRWIYSTGHKSASYHIPGRAPSQGDIAKAGGRDAYELKEGVHPYKWQVSNTATKLTVKTYNTDGGRVIASGEMGYHESTELYPQNAPDVWADLCGRNIRHHRFPDTAMVPLSGNSGTTVTILGVQFDNIQHPLDFDGNPITDIIGYEILRGSREGNKSIVAKGILSNMAEYDVPGTTTNRKGLYLNYPFNDLRTDPFLSKGVVKGGCQSKGYIPMGSFRRDIFSFHSPETQFRNPYLSSSELRIETGLTGTATGSFESVFKHPRHKMVRDFALYTAGVVGVGIGLTAVKGKKTTIVHGAKAFDAGVSGKMLGQGSGTISSGASTNPDLDSAGTGGGSVAGTIIGRVFRFLSSSLGLSDNRGFVGKSTSTQVEGGTMSNAPSVLNIAANTFLFTYFLSEGAEQALQVIRKLIPYEQYAYQYNGHGFYSDTLQVASGNSRRKIVEADYLEPHLQEFGAEYRINNLFRQRAVVLKLGDSLEDLPVKDDSRQTVGTKGLWDNPTQAFSSTISAYYGALKNNLPAQYGQIESVLQVPVSNGVLPTVPDKTIKSESPVIFGGDQYINRYTEKNTMFFFNDWLMGQPDGYEFDYNLTYNIPYPRYWINTQEYDLGRVMQPFMKTATGSVVGGAIGALFDGPNSNTGATIGTIVGGAAGAALSLNDFNNKVLPNDYAHMDRRQSDCTSKISFGINKAYFYLFCNGVRDFFVESEINLAHRDHDDEPASRHYDAYNHTDLKSLFRSDIIKAGNHYKYDYSLSVSKLFSNQFSWGAVLPRDYNPKVSAQCYSYYPNRAIYSLRQQEELKKDNWASFLAQNYRDFSGRITSIKSVNKSGAIIYFEHDSPMMFQGVDQLRTEGGIKITIGDGGLFNQTLQSMSNADVQYEYGSCQNRGSIIGTPAGVFSISGDQGKIFRYGDGLAEISRDGNKWWFAQYLTSKLLDQFPDFVHKDNPVIGVGSMSGYDNVNGVAYFSKVDYQLKPEFLKRVSYHPDKGFILDGYTPIQLSNTYYFDNASFTVSFDTERNAFISFHDWIPEAIFASKSHILTVKDGGIWKHNSRCDLFCNFYGQDYPFEIEFPVSTGQDVTSLRSVEYMLEAYKYSNNCRDQFHALDGNFDRAVVFNSDQCSGTLLLKPRPKNNPFLINQYPVVNHNGMEILVSKEEHKYRFNTFFDLVSDRGEQSGKERTIWNVQPNGYIKSLNPIAINYNKSPMQRKKFRHYTQSLLLKRTICGDMQLRLKLVNQKQLKSSR